MSDNEESQILASKYRRMENFVSDTMRLSHDDYALIGRFIQAYCVADFEARRVISAMRDISGATGLDAAQLSDKDTITHLSLCAKAWKVGENVAEGASKAADILSLHHDIRHTFSHFAGRRMRSDDIFVFLSTSKRHNKLKHGIEVDSDTDGDAYVRVMPVNSVQEELAKLEGHGQYLASLGSFLREQATALRSEHAELTRVRDR